MRIEFFSRMVFLKAAALGLFLCASSANSGEAGIPNWFYYWGQVLGTNDPAHYKYTDADDDIYAATRVTSATEWVITFRSHAKGADPIPPTNHKHINGFAAVVFHERWHRDHRIHNHVVHGARAVPFVPPRDCDADGDGICNREPTDPPGFMDGGWEKIIGSDPARRTSLEVGAEWAELNATYGYEKQDWSSPGSQKHASAFTAPLFSANAKTLRPPGDHLSRLGGFTLSEAKPFDDFVGKVKAALGQKGDGKTKALQDVYVQLPDGFHRVVFWDMARSAGLSPGALTADDAYARMAGLMAADKDFDATLVGRPAMRHFYGQWREWSKRRDEGAKRLRPLTMEKALDVLLALEDPGDVAAYVPAFLDQLPAGDEAIVDRFVAYIQPRLPGYAVEADDPARKSFQSMRFGLLCEIGLALAPMRMEPILRDLPKAGLNGHVQKALPAMEAWARGGHKFPARYDALKVYHDNNVHG